MENNQSIVLRGISASPGFCIGKILKIKPLDLNLSPSAGQDKEVEIRRFKRVQEAVKEQITAMKERAETGHDRWTVKIFDTHLFLVTDPELQDNVERYIREAGVTAEYALLTIRDKLVQMLANTGSELIEERAADIRDISDRMIALLTGQETINLSGVQEEVIIAAKDFSPMETSQLDTALVKGFITETGGKSSHTAIMAKSIGIPAVAGVGGILNVLEQGDLVMLDGEEGLVHIRPDSEALEGGRKKIKKMEDKKIKTEEFIHRKTLSKNRIPVDLEANIGRLEDLEKASEYGAEGIGLFRTEFLFMESSSAPDEEKQFHLYKEILYKMNPLPVIIRTLDIGSDKVLPYVEIPKEENPALGLRGIRYCLKHPALFRTQLRALARASVFGNLKIMFPMISTLEEYLEGRKILSEVCRNLKNEGVPVSDSLEIGIMIETPAAALMAEELAQAVDFFSIGTNDLIQYCMAADRMNALVSHLYQPGHPAVLKLIQMVTEAADAHGKWIGVCGEMAGDMEMVPLLLNLGVRKLSMSPVLIPEIREALSKLVL